MGDDPEDRQAFQIPEDGLQPVGPGHDPDVTTSFDATRLDFGHYAGRSIEELARIDPEYLQWLGRHPSGARYRVEIRRVLGVSSSPTDWNR
jgi:broad specificity phosphatase PhoE